MASRCSEYIQCLSGFSPVLESGNFFQNSLDSTGMNVSYHLNTFGFEFLEVMGLG